MVRRLEVTHPPAEPPEVVARMNLDAALGNVAGGDGQ